MFRLWRWADQVELVWGVVSKSDIRMRNDFSPASMTNYVWLCSRTQTLGMLASTAESTAWAIVPTSTEHLLHVLSEFYLFSCSLGLDPMIIQTSWCLQCLRFPYYLFLRKKTEPSNFRWCSKSARNLASLIPITNGSRINSSSALVILLYSQRRSWNIQRASKSAMDSGLLFAGLQKDKAVN